MEKMGTIEIPLELKESFEILAESKGKEFKQFIVDLLMQCIEDMEDMELGEKAMEIKKTGLMSKEESMKLFNSLKS